MKMTREGERKKDKENLCLLSLMDTKTSLYVDTLGTDLYLVCVKTFTYSLSVAVGEFTTLDPLSKLPTLTHS